MQALKRRDNVVVIIVGILILILCALGLYNMRGEPYFRFDSETGQTVKEGRYKVKGRLVSLDTGKLEIDKHTPIYVETANGTYEGAYYRRKVSYIGESPTEDNPLYGITKEEVTETTLTKEDFELDGDTYISKIERPSNIIGISLKMSEREYRGRIEYVEEGYLIRIGGEDFDKLDKVIVEKVVRNLIN